MAKKKHHKRQQFKYGRAKSGMAIKTELSPDSGSIAKVVLANTAGSEMTSFGYVRADLTKVAVLATVFVSAELILWLAFNHTGLGASVYRLIRI